MESGAACRDAALQLGQCMEENSPCVKAGGAIAECSRTAAGVAGCEAYQRAYYECRRAQVDTRARIHGKRFVDSSKGQ
jgi:hypothetical protein